MPQQIVHHFSMWFDPHKSEIYCQFANQSDAQPHIRTMRLYAVTVEGCLEFLTRTDVNKWSDLTVQPRVALCFLNLNFGQITVEGEALLKTVTTHPEDVKKYWSSLPEHIRGIYPEGEVVLGIISVMPNLWEVLTLSAEGYLLNSRILYRLIDGVWDEKKIEVVT